jgi:hypothetical protein
MAPKKGEIVPEIETWIKERVATIRKLEGKARGYEKRKRETMLAMGQALYEIRERVKAERLPGGFQGVAAKEFPDWSRSSAYDLTLVWEVWKDCPSLGQFDPAALTVLAARKAKRAREKALAMAEGGRYVTHHLALELKEEEGELVEAPEPEPAPHQDGPEQPAARSHHESAPEEDQEEEGKEEERSTRLNGGGSFSTSSTSSTSRNKDREKKWIIFGWTITARPRGRSGGFKSSLVKALRKAADEIEGLTVKAAPKEEAFVPKGVGPVDGADDDEVNEDEMEAEMERAANR